MENNRSTEHDMQHPLSEAIEQTGLHTDQCESCTTADRMLSVDISPVVFPACVVHLLKC